MTQPPNSDHDTLSLLFLAEGEQRAEDVANRLAAFIRGAQRSLDIAIYDFRLSPPLRAIIMGALQDRAAVGVRIRIVYDADKPAAPNLLAGMDPAPGGTGAFVQGLGFPWRRIDSQKLMHEKYIVRDAGLPNGSVWTGSANFTDDSWTLQEGNLLTFAAPDLALAYARDFDDLWNAGTIVGTGDFDVAPTTVRFGGQPVAVQVLFSPGRGVAIDDDIAQIVAGAQRRVRICSMLLNSGALLNALLDVLHAGQVPVDGIYDRTQMASVLQQWQEIPHNHWKIRAIEEIVQTAHLVGKNSTPYSPTGRHDFMHAKILLVDDTVITGSYNFSRSAELNAENILLMHSGALAEAYSQMIDHLQQKYG
jgi:phosphatidylserine/phosphatidylglycerophosphate/cardiolipin synthase-like enzyme